MNGGCVHQMYNVHTDDSQTFSTQFTFCIFDRYMLVVDGIHELNSMNNEERTKSSYIVYYKLQMSRILDTVVEFSILLFELSELKDFLIINLIITLLYPYFRHQNPKSLWQASNSMDSDSNITNVTCRLFCLIVCTHHKCI